MKKENKLSSITLHWFVLIIMFACSLLSGQIEDIMTRKKEVTIEKDIPDENMYPSKEMILEKTIDPEEYIVGPGDKIAFNMLSSDGIVSLSLKISPTGEVLIPVVGVVFIDKLTLARAFNKIKKKCLDNYANAKINLSLKSLRQFKIQTIGAVYAPGFVVINPVNRLTDAIEKSDGLHRLADEENISITRLNGLNIICSLKSYHLNGSLENNPVLRAGDIINVSYLEEFSKIIEESVSYKKEFIIVMGFVYQPKKHIFVSGYTILDYVALSGGILDWGTYNNLSINRHGIVISSDMNTILQPGDQIYIPANLKYRLLGNMSILQVATGMLTLYLTYQAATN